MSRIGKRPIKLLEGISVAKDNNFVVVSLGNEKKKIKLLPGIEISIKPDELTLSNMLKNKESSSYHGLIARSIQNAQNDLKNGIKKELEIVGTGYRAKVEGNNLILTVGYSHDIVKNIPEGVNVEVKKNDISVSGTDRQIVGELAANIRKVRPPEVYKGKGIKYKDEIIKKKAGKAAQAVGSGA